MSLRSDYAGPFDPDVGLASFSRQLLAQLGREYLLNGHLQDRVGLPLVAKRFGGDAYVQSAIEEWMSASPIYQNLSGILEPIEANLRAAEPLRETMDRIEAWLIRHALSHHGNRRAATARWLGITREGLYKKMKRLNIE